jgi:hypothetical protein
MIENRQILKRIRDQPSLLHINSSYCKSTFATRKSRSFYLINQPDYLPDGVSNSAIASIIGLLV